MQVHGRRESATASFSLLAEGHCFLWFSTLSNAIDVGQLLLPCAFFAFATDRWSFVLPFRAVMRAWEMCMEADPFQEGKVPLAFHPWLLASMIFQNEQSAFTVETLLVIWRILPAHGGWLLLLTSSSRALCGR